MCTSIGNIRGAHEQILTYNITKANGKYTRGITKQSLWNKEKIHNYNFLGRVIMNYENAWLQYSKICNDEAKKYFSSVYVGCDACTAATAAEELAAAALECWDAIL